MKIQRVGNFVVTSYGEQVHFLNFTADGFNIGILRGNEPAKLRAIPCRADDRAELAHGTIVEDLLNFMPDGTDADSAVDKLDGVAERVLNNATRENLENELIDFASSEGNLIARFAGDYLVLQLSNNRLKITLLEDGEPADAFFDRKVMDHKEGAHIGTTVLTDWLANRAQFYSVNHDSKDRRLLKFLASKHINRTIETLGA